MTLDREKCGAEFFYKNPHSNDPSNWWVPTVRCLHEWVESSYFDLVQEFLLPQTDEMMSLRRKHVNRLRERFPEDRYSFKIRTIRGLGYRLEVVG